MTPRRRIVLVGGGHAHVHVVRRLGPQLAPDTSLTLVSRGPLTPYSGMLPGVIAGLYRPEQAHIDLERLAARSGALFVRGEAGGIDRGRKEVILSDGRRLPYDLLSIDIGIVPRFDTIAGAREHATAVKPIDDFLGKFGALIKTVRAGESLRLAVVGGGAAGTELILSMQRRLCREAERGPAGNLAFTLVTRGEILDGHPPRVRATFRRILAARGVAVLERHTVTAIVPGRVTLADGAAIDADHVLLATEAAAPEWLARTGLDCDDQGFVMVAPTLQATNDPDVFAAGDCVTLSESPRPKSGVFAVRAGPPLAANLGRRLRGEPPEDWHPQRRHLALITSGERYAVASRGRLMFKGQWVWRLKDVIDRRWIARNR